MTFVANQTGQLAFLNNINDPWTAWVPTVVGLTSSVTEARYKQIGKTVYCQAVITATAGAAGTITVSMPVTARTPAGVGSVLGAALATDVSVPTFSVGAVLLSSTTLFAFIGPSAGALWSAGTPYTWAVGDTIRFSATYEAA